MKKSVACIGNGFVGGSLTTVLSEKGFNVYVYDKSGKLAEGGRNTVSKDPDRLFDAVPAIKSVSSLVRAMEQNEYVPNFTGIYFVCLPTPMCEDGSCDTSIVESVLDDLSSVPGKRIAVVKSTVPPGSTEKWNKKYEGTGLRVVFNPEFLTEANALDDMRNQNRIVLGGPRPYINKVKQLFQQAFPSVPIVKTSSTTAEMVKYTTNCFLATKVAFANEISQICERLDTSGFNIDYDKVIEYSKYDTRLGNSHWAVPGPDGHKGYGGHCFSKDINALMFVARELGVDPKVMQAGWDKNLEVREWRDWEEMVGRAVSEKKAKQ